VTPYALSSNRLPRRARDFGRFLRSALTGGAATLADVAVIGIAVGLFQVAPRAANVPALLVGAAIQFFGNRHYAFRASSGGLARHAILFAVVEVVALALNALLYDAVASRLPLDAGGAMVARALTTNLVFVLWSYPAWRRVFASGTPKQRGVPQSMEKPLARAASSGFACGAPCIEAGSPHPPRESST
jgi:putative flippase GtrA